MRAYERGLTRRSSGALGGICAPWPPRAREVLIRVVESRASVAVEGGGTAWRKCVEETVLKIREKKRRRQKKGLG